MSATFLSHVKCGGNIVIDATPTAKLIAPSFQIGQGGLKSLVLDIQVINGGKLIPDFMCTKCGTVFPTNVPADNRLAVELQANCQICGNDKLVKDLSVHSEIVTICNSCEAEIRLSIKRESFSSERIREYVQQYNIKARFIVTPLVTVLRSPIII